MSRQIWSQIRWLCADYDLNSYGATKVALFVSYFHRGLSNQLALNANMKIALSIWSIVVRVSTIAGQTSAH